MEFLLLKDYLVIIIFNILVEGLLILWFLFSKGGIKKLPLHCCLWVTVLCDCDEYNRVICVGLNWQLLLL